MLRPPRCFQTGLLLMAAALPSQAGNFSTDFNSSPPAPPAGTAVYGNAVIEGTGGVGASGCLKLTKAVNSEQGSFVLDDLDGGAQIYGFDVSYDLLLGGGTFNSCGRHQPLLRAGPAGRGLGRARDRQRLDLLHGHL